MKKREVFKVEGENVNRTRKHCPKCGPGVFLAEHKNRVSCGKCGYTEFKSGGKKEKPQVQQPTSEPAKNDNKSKEIEEDKKE